MAESALLITVPQAEDAVAALRQRYDPSAAVGIPAHITILVPFIASQSIDAEVLEQIAAALQEQAAFSFRLAGIGRFAATAYLVPEPAAPFVALTESLVRHFPAYPPYAGEFDAIVPHLTVAHGRADDAARAAAELLHRLAARGPIEARCNAVALWDNASGRWRERHDFGLRSNDV